MQRVAALTDRRGPSALLSPFFRMAPWMMLVEPVEPSERRWLRNRTRDRRWLCRTLVRRRVQVVLCGWIDHDSVEHLLGHGISVVIGPCDRSALALAGAVGQRAATPLPTFETLLPGGS